MNPIVSDKPLNFNDGVTFVEDIVRDYFVSKNPFLSLLDKLAKLDLSPEVNDGIAKAVFVARNSLANGEPVLAKLNALKNTY